jgi:hypothetical protein
MKRAVVDELIDYYRKAPYLKTGKGKRRRIHFCPFCGERVRHGVNMRIELAGHAGQKK